MQNHLKIFAKQFHKLGFNVTCITNYLSEFNFTAKNIAKVPYHDWERYETNRQSIDELLSYDWENATGLGVVLGYENLCAIDIDGCIDDYFIQNILRELKLPSDYEWVTKTGSNRGYHILFYSNKSEKDVLIYPIIKETSQSVIHDLKPFDTKIKETGTKIQAFISKPEFRHKFEKMEFMPEKQLVMPPSLHKSTFKYRFINTDFPKSKPLKLVNNDLLLDLADKYIELKDGQVFGGSLAWAPQGKYLNPTISIDHDLSPQKILERWRNQLYLVLDIETDGLPSKKSDEDSIEQWPRIIQIAWLLTDKSGHIIKKCSEVVKGRNKHVDYLNLDFSVIVV
jgi:hypothetical protein